jgi:hypothetical protein
MLQLSRSADVEGIQQLATLRTYDRSGSTAKSARSSPARG